MFFTSWLEHQLLKTAGKVLAAPVTVPVKSASWLLEQIHREVEAEQIDEDRVMEQLMELQLRYEMEEIEKEEFEAQEKELLERLNAIREHKRDEQFEEDEAWWRRYSPKGWNSGERGQTSHFTYRFSIRDQIPVSGRYST